MKGLESEKKRDAYLGHRNNSRLAPVISVPEFSKKKQPQELHLNIGQGPKRQLTAATKPRLEKKKES